MITQRSIWCEKKTTDWHLGDLIPFRWDDAKGEFAGYIKVIGIKPDGSFSLDFIQASSKTERPA